MTEDELGRTRNQLDHLTLQVNKLQEIVNSQNEIIEQMRVQLNIEPNNTLGGDRKQQRRYNNQGSNTAERGSSDIMSIKIRNYADEDFDDGDEGCMMMDEGISASDVSFDESSVRSAESAMHHQRLAGPGEDQPLLDMSMDEEEED